MCGRQVHAAAKCSGMLSLPAKPSTAHLLVHPLPPLHTLTMPPHSLTLPHTSLTPPTTLSGNPPIVSLTPSGPDPMGLAVLRAGLGSDAELVQAGWRTGSSVEDVSLCARVMGRLGQPRSLATEQKVGF